MVLAWMEYDGGSLSQVSLETLTLARGLARELGVDLEVILIGEAGRELVNDLQPYGVSRAHLVQNPHGAAYAPEAWAQCVIHLMEGLQPRAVIAGGTDRGSEVMAYVAARLDLPLAANCMAVQAGEVLRLTRIRWGGSLLEEAELDGDLWLLTCSPHAVPITEEPAGGSVAVVEHEIQLDEKLFRAQLADRVTAGDERVSLAEARVVVGGGRGVGSEAGFAVLEDLARLLGGAVGCSRAVTNLGWRPHADQIGQTGTRIAPDLYIACGVSGAIQHMVGCKGAKSILAINTDPEAPILARAQFAVVGDLHEVVPAICEEIRASQPGS